MPNKHEQGDYVSASTEREWLLCTKLHRLYCAHAHVKQFVAAYVRAYANTYDAGRRAMLDDTFDKYECRHGSPIDCGHIMSDTFVCNGIISHVPARMTRIGDYFSIGLAVTYIDLTPLSHVTEIGTHFMTHNGLLTIDLSPFTKVRRIGKLFMAHATRLRTIDLSPLQLDQWPDEFCWKSSVKQVHAPALHGTFRRFTTASTCNVDFSRSTTDYVKSKFIDLSRFAGVITDKLCLGTCARFVDTNALRGVTEIGNCFLARTNIEYIDTDTLSSIERVGNDFLSDCDSLRFLEPTRMTRLSSVGSFFLYGTSLCYLDLGSMTLSIGMCFLSKMNSLQRVQLPKITNTRIPRGFLAHTPMLQVVAFQDMSHVTEIERAFIMGSGIEKADFSTFINVKNIDHWFLLNCPHRDKLNLTPFGDVGLARLMQDANVTESDTE